MAVFVRLSNRKNIHRDCIRGIVTGRRRMLLYSGNCDGKS